MKSVTQSIVFGATLLTVMTTPLTAGEEGGAQAPATPPPPPFIKAPIAKTAFTQNCKELGLKEPPKGEKRRTYALDPANFRRLEKVNEAFGAEDWDTALENLREIESRAKDSRPYDLAKAHEYMGYVYLSMNQYDQAIRYFTQVIDAQILPVKNEQSLIRNVAGLYLSIDPPQSDKAMGIIEDWFKTAVKPKPNDYVLLAQAAVLGKDYRKSICPIS